MASQPQGRGKPKPPKAKVLQALRNIHTEQLAKLQQKYQFEQDLLEDIRTYSKQRSAIEKEYVQALQKLNNNFLQKREFSLKKEADINHRVPESVWKRVLEETENLSKKRMEISDGLQCKIVDEIKIFKANKTQVYKKCQELLQKVQEELFETIRELSKSKKNYIESEKLAQVAGEQAAEAEDKFKKKNTSFFKTKATLGKNVTKSSSRKEISEKRATMARNEYLLNLAASNAHAVRYYCTDLQEIMNSVYGDFYETIREYFVNIGNLEVGAAANAKEGFENVLSEAGMIDKDYCVQCFLTKNKVFTEVHRYSFDPWKHDQVTTLLLDRNAGLALNKEARKLAMRLVREQRSIKEKQKALSGIKSTTLKTSDAATGEPAIQDTEQSPDSLREGIRHAELIKLKSEACLDLLKEAGVNVEEWLKSANSLSPAEQDLTDSQTSLDSDTENAGWMDDEWDVDDTFTGEYDSDSDANSLASTGSLPLQCVALYNFEASTADELSITENEELEVVEKDSDGWCKGRNKKGLSGYFPESYIEFRQQKRPSIISNHSSSGHSGSYTDGSLGASPAGSSCVTMPQEQPYICLVKALFDYEAVGDDELSFQEGDIIKVTKKDDNGVDDGFWEGRVDEKFGVFPSLVVEEIEGSEVESTPAYQDQESTYAVPPSSVKVKATKIDDYIELPKDYVPGGTTINTPSSTSFIQPKRKAPAPPAAANATSGRGSTARASLDPIDRRRVQTENITTLKKPDWTSSYTRSVSHEFPPVEEGTSNQLNYNRHSSYTADYVNTCDLPAAESGSTNAIATGAVSKPIKPPPPSSKSRKTSQSKSYV